MFAWKGLNYGKVTLFTQFTISVVFVLIVIIYCFLFSAVVPVPCTCPITLPPVLGGDFLNLPCHYCLLGPCIIARPPPFMWRDVETLLGDNICKRRYVYCQLYKVLGELKVWFHPHYQARKRMTSVLGARELMPQCVVHVSEEASFIWKGLLGFILVLFE